MNIIHEKCDPKLAEDKNLPYTAYLVQYEVAGQLKYDIAVSSKAADLFDHYYDKYKTNFKRFDQSQGTVDPRRWMSANKPKEQPPRKKRRRKPSEDA